MGERVQLGVGWRLRLALIGAVWCLSACTTLFPERPEGATTQTEVPTAVEAKATAPAASAAHAASAQAPAAALAPVELQGQLSVKLLATAERPAKGVSLGFFFSGQPEAGRLDLMTPLGSQLAQIGWTTSGAWLRRAGGGDAAPETQFGADLNRRPSSEDGLERFASIDALSEQVLGEAVPLQTLVHWMQGRPDPLRLHVPGPGNGLDAGTFRQDGWLIDTREWPRRLQAARAADGPLRGIQIKVYLDR